MQKETSTVRDYLEQGVAEKSTGELLLLLYDTGLRACRRRDRQLAIGVLAELMGGVDIDQGDVSTGLIRLYDYALREVRENRFDFAERLMVELGQSYRQCVEHGADTPTPTGETHGHENRAAA